MNATAGDRFLDTRGQCWTVLDTGQLQNDLAPGVLIRSWDSLDTCLGPLFLLPPDDQENAMPKPGDKYLDIAGDYWLVAADGSLWLDDMNRTVDYVTGKWGPLTLIEDEPHEAQSEPPAPDYYVFPGGVQAIDLSRHLTSNAGQAVQYLARSSRIDGVRKEDPVADLYKARDMIDDEIARLEDAA